MFVTITFSMYKFNRNDKTDYCLHLAQEKLGLNYLYNTIVIIKYEL